MSDAETAFGPAENAPLTDDLIQPFRIEGSEVRGQLVRLGSVADEVLRRHDYPTPVATLLGETLALSAVLAGALKYDGIFTFQTKGDGPVSLVVADLMSGGAMRGYAQFDQKKLEAAGLANGAAPVPALLGKGYLAFTVDQGADTDRYQGIVELTGNSLSECARHYFERSEQIQTSIKSAAGRGPDGRWRAAALMIQRMPPVAGAEAADAEETWQKTLALAGTCTDKELLDPALEPHALLYRLFHEDGVRAFTPRPLRFGCRCSEERAVRVLRSFPRAELKELEVDGRIQMTCEFCRETYNFDPDALPEIAP